MIFNRNSVRQNRVILLCCISFSMLAGGLTIVPVIKFNDPLSTVVQASKGELLGAKIADDGQWRFPPADQIPEKFRKAIILYEDRKFAYHKGIDILRILKAAYDNVEAGQVKSGGSTIHMQLARIFRKNPSRSILNKMYEMLLALKLEFVYSKTQILGMYADNAPFGGNVVGIEAASWRYFKKKPIDLTWAETATLAVLPNSPAMIHPGRNRQELKRKRDDLLYRLYKSGEFDSLYLELSLLENLPDKPYPLPQMATHLVEWLDKSGFKGKNSECTIEKGLQEKLNQIVRLQHKNTSQNAIHNMGVLVIENETGNVLGYVGNTEQTGDINHEHYVDMVRANRSSGSILKPILFAFAVDEGLINPEQLLPDIPGRISGYRPRNFDRGFEGAVQADKALSRSLNIPAVYLLQEYSIDKFILNLNDLGLSSINRSADHYGLPLILGGADVNLWELTGAYASLARILNRYSEQDRKYAVSDIRPPSLMRSVSNENLHIQSEADRISAAAIWLTFNAMTQVERPDELGKWEKFSSPGKIGWKTGTSYSFRDAWAVGVTKKYTVGVWVGNATGEGRPGMTGVNVAAPVLFEAFSYLDASSWFDEPVDDLKEIVLCADSGFPLSPNCEKANSTFVPYNSKFHKVCPYHQVIITDVSGKWRMLENCDPELETIVKKQFLLPPLMEYFYAKNHPEYRSIPDWHPSCSGELTENNPMAFIYPTDITRILIPVEYNNEKGRVIFKLAHRNPQTSVFWYLENELIATTIDFHEVQILKKPGQYKIMVVDDAGNTLEQSFEVVE